MGWVKKFVRNVTSSPVKYAFPIQGVSYDLVKGRNVLKDPVWQAYGAAGAAGLGYAALGAGGAGAAGASGAASSGGTSMSPGWGSFASGLFGGAMNWMSQSQTNQQNLDIAREQMNFQGMMSNTAHQREVADLKAAGLNPVLSAGGNGSSTPSGSQATMQAPQIDMPGIWSMMMKEKELDQTDKRIANETARTAADLEVKKQAVPEAKSRIELNRLKQILLQKGMPRAEVEGMIWKIIKGQKQNGKKMIDRMDESHQYQKQDTLP